MSRIYTGTGDEGDTSLYGGSRVEKSHPRVSAYGTVDELNAFLGRALLAVEDEATHRRLSTVQHDLFAIGAELAAPDAESREKGGRITGVPEGRVEAMERWIDEAEEETGPLERFVLPGGGAGGAALHVARTVCRRAERAVVALDRADGAPPIVLRYLNRLSDLLFALARLENLRSGDGDVFWEKEG